MHDSNTSKRSRYIDVSGALAVTAGLIILVYTLTQGNNFGWISIKTLGLLALAVILLVAFVVIEAHSPAPLVRLNIFRSRTLTGANLISLLASGEFGALMFVLTIYLQEVLGYSPLATGLAILPLALLLILMTNVGSRLITRLGVKPLLVTGLTTVIVGLLLLTRISVGSTYLEVLPGLLIVGLGMGPVFAGMVIAATMGVPNEDQGLASGLLNTSQQIGAGLGLAIVAAASTAHVTSLLQQGNSSNSASLTGGLQYGIIACACFAVAGALVALFVVSAKPSSFATHM